MNAHVKNFLEQAISSIRSNNFDKTEILLKNVLNIEPNNFIALNIFGILLRIQNNHKKALAYFDRTIYIKPDFFEAWYNKGNIFQELKRYDEALNHYDKVIYLKPNYVEAWYNKGNILKELKRYDEALNNYDKAIYLKSDYIKAMNNKGNILKELKRYDEALNNYDKAIYLKPDFAEAWYNKGNIFQELKRYDEALKNYDKAIYLKPEFVEAWYNKGIILKELKRYDEALNHYRKVIYLKPDYEFISGQIFHLKMLICDWSGFDNSIVTCVNEVKKLKKAIYPFAFLGLVDDAKLQLKCSETYAKDKHDLNLGLGSITKNSKKEKIRIGYYSSCFHNHATSYLIAELLEEHDKKKFEVYGFSFGPHLNDRYRQRVSKAFDYFNIVNSLTDKEVALLSRKIGIDIAIDLDGYANNSRTNIFSYRSAPIQINFLGYPGSMGVSYMDYIIADKTIIPKELKNFYSEKIIYLPNSYQPNDSKRKISAKKFTKKELNLPDNCFIFCCFNNTYKILPEVFDIWMEILKNVENSVIWLLEDNINSSASINLKREARARGVSDQRLIFSHKVPLDEHLARLKLADLFLDTFPYNAHTTCSDALWAGLPVLTYSGKSFVSRVGASLLNSLGLEKLIVDSLYKYKTIAIQLAKNKDQLLLIKKKLSNNKIVSPLFNTSLFVKNLEKSYQIIYSRYLNNLTLENIEIN